jgi:L-ascorbate metabolism protein UlaG (beta-lactamase superfamily)
VKEPFLADDALLAEIEEVKRRAPCLDLWWLGQSGFLLHYRERWFLIDPYLSDSLTTKYTGTDKPHVRMTRRVVDPGELARRLRGVTVTCSHAHTDHLDPDTLRPLVRSESVSTLIAPKASLQLAYERSGAATEAFPFLKLAGIDDGERIGRGRAKITAVASAHETVERDEQGHCKFLGYVFEFHPPSMTDSGDRLAFATEHTVYHSGDTVLYDGLVDKLRQFKIDIALLPINGRAPERRVAGNLSGREAAWLAKEIGAKLVIPCHYDMFEFNTATPDEFVAECERLGQPYKVLRQGERLTWSG